MDNNSMLGKWDSWYKDLKKISSFRYGNTETYKLKFKIPNIKEIKQKLTSSIVNAFIQSNFIKNTEEEVEDKDEDF